MKRLLTFLLSAIIALFFSCNTAQSGDKKAGKMIFAETEHDFGEIAQNSVAEFAFIFKNVGKEPIIISNVQTSCGCTVPNWSREPVEKNQSGVVKVKYNTHIIGSFRKTITVYSNASNSPVTLVIKGKVLPVTENTDNK